MRRLALLTLALAAACRASAVEAPAPPPERAAPSATGATVAPADREAGVVEGARSAAAPGDAIVVAGERIPIGAPVVLWSDPGGYDAYREAPFFAAEERADGPKGKRYRPGRARAGDAQGREPDAGDAPPTRAELEARVDQFVIHYDACGLSRTCFDVLHDRRGLSVHFLLDLDGTLYQTLDLADTAWHARQANPRSIGVEIANLGAYAPGARSVLDDWYVADERGTRIAIPASKGDGGLRTAGFVARPARPQRVGGTVQGAAQEMYDLTPQQYDTLVRLAAALCATFPRIRPDAPRDAAGAVRTDALSADEFAAFSGWLGHLHVTADKQDPGPAFDWERFLSRVRRLRALNGSGESVPVRRS